MKKFITDKIIDPFLRTLADVPWFGPTLSAVLLATIINVLTNTLSAWGPWYGWVFIIVLVIVAAVVVISYNRKYAYWTRNLGPIADIDPPQKFEGLILLLTNQDTAREAIQHHMPALKHVWLIVTPEKQKDVSALTGEFPNLPFSTLPISNLYDTQSCYDAVRQIYRRRTRDVKISPKNTISDITGGTKPMTMGMIVACIEGGFPIEHVPTVFDSTNKPIRALAPIEIRIKQS